VVVSSVTPRMFRLMFEYQFGDDSRRLRIAPNNARSSSLPGRSRTDGSFSARLPSITSSVASPPSSRIMFGVPPSCHSKIRWVKSQYSSRSRP
jgi:hypothetical protein